MPRAPEAASSAPPCPLVARLAERFRSDPVWVAAAALLRDDVASAVRFTHLEGPWRLVRRDGVSVLEPGEAPSPDFGFTFGPGAIERLLEARGDMASTAITLFECMAEREPERAIRLRLIAPPARLLQRGYIRLLWHAGPALLRFAASLGVGDLRDLLQILRALRQDDDDAVGRWLRARTAARAPSR